MLRRSLSVLSLLRRPPSAATARTAIPSFSSISAPGAVTSASTTMAAAAAAVCALNARSFSHTPLRLKNPYKVLGVPQGASVDAIKKAHRKMAAKWHPDICKEPNAGEKFQEIQMAYEQIKTGVYIPKEGAGGEQGSNPAASRFGNFKYRTATKQNVSFDDFMKEMHAPEAAAKQAAADAAADEAGSAAGGGGAPRADPMSQARAKFNVQQDFRIQAWFRLLSAWGVCFLVLRFALLLIFPPKVEKKTRPAPIAPREKPGPARMPRQQQQGNQHHQPHASY